MISKTYTHDQTIPSTAWYVTHNLGTSDIWFMIKDSENRIMFANTTIVDNNSLIVSLSAPGTGKVVVMTIDSSADGGSPGTGPITSRSGLIEYCLRKLGKPVLEINIAEEQMNDRIDEALQYFKEYHSEALQKIYAKYIVTACHLQFTEAVAPNFKVGETLVGSTSNANLIVYDIPEVNKVRSRYLNGGFIPGETVIGAESGATAVVALGGIFIGDTQTHTLHVDDNMMSISNILPINQAGGSSGNYMFDVRYQLHLNDIFNLSHSNIQYYTQVQGYLALLNFTLNTQSSFTFSRMTNELSLNVDWDTMIQPGQVIVAEGYSAINPESAGNIYNDIFIKRYAVALFKQQWAQNLSKYKGLQLVGGVDFNVESLMSQAQTELAAIESEVMTKFSAPLGFFTG